MYTRRKRKREQERHAATSHAARVVQRLWRRKDPIRCKVVRKPFWIFRGESAHCFDANVLYAYVAAESDRSDVFTRQPYTRAELFALAFVADMPHLSPEAIAVRRAERDVRREIVAAMETEVVSGVSRMASAYPRYDDRSSRDLLEALADLVALGGLQNAGFVLTHAIAQEERRMEGACFHEFATEVRTLGIMALLRHQI